MSRRAFNVVTVAVANKLARIVWAYPGARNAVAGGLKAGLRGADPTRL